MIKDRFVLTDFDEYLHKRYAEEQADNRYLYTRASITITVITFVLISFIGLLKCLPKLLNPYGVILVILLLATGALLASSFYSIIRIMTPKFLAYLPNMSDLLDHPEKLKNYYVTNHTEDFE